jgi:ferredoxin-NADP reductase
MTGPDPMEFGWWLASRAAGVVALLCITVSVGVGLAMAGRVSKRPGLARTLMSVHRQTALVGLVAIAVHGITLLGDRFLKPSIGDIVVPFTSAHEPLWTGLGVTGGWLAAILGLSYWIRGWIGAGLWRKLHRATVLVYVLSVAHTLGAGTDASEPWMRALLVTTGAPILFLFVMRVMTPRTAPAFRRFRVAGMRPESSTVMSLQLEPADRKPVAAHEPGQFVSLRLAAADRQVVRSYSLSSSPRAGGYRISVKREPGGVASEHLHSAVSVGDTLELSGPSGRFVLGGGAGPVALISAGIGVTPVLAMLETLADARSEREVWWIHGARNGDEHAFRGEARAHVARLPRGHSHVRYSRPHPRDVLGRDYDAPGRLTGADVLALGVPAEAEFRLCGPSRFVADLTADLVEHGVARGRIQSESFGGAPAAPAPASATPAPIVAGDGPAVAFSRSGVTTAWDGAFASLLDLAEANAVPAASGCRVGACHGCRAGVLSGNVRHEPEPLEQPPPGSALLCCAVPDGDVVLDA